MASYESVLFSPSRKNNALAYFLDGIKILLGSFLIALISQLSIPLWFTPIPLSMQPLSILFVGAFLGSRRGALTVLTFLAEGGFGLPFFAGGASGWAVLAGPRGGYLLGYVIAAYIVGWILEKRKNTFTLTFLACFFGSLAILVLGVMKLSLYLGIKKALLLGFCPFFLGDFLKVLLAAYLISRANLLKRVSI